MPLTWRIRDPRSPEQIREHYEVEKGLASQLRAASRSDRMQLYGAVYDELFRRVPHHPQLVNRASIEDRRSMARRQVAFLRTLCPPNPVVLEIGAGDCLISKEMAPHAQTAYAVDVSDEITKLSNPPPNLHVILSDGTSIDVPEGSVHLAFSNQLMEHLHPDDALDQLRQIYRALAPGGLYFCITPNRLSGPHDVSQNFEPVACGFHLKEYTATELQRLFKTVGFRKFRVYVGLDGIYMRIPMLLAKATEAVFSVFPSSLRRAVAPSAPFRLLLGIRLLAVK